MHQSAECHAAMHSHCSLCLKALQTVVSLHLQVHLIVMLHMLHHVLDPVRVVSSVLRETLK